MATASKRCTPEAKYKLPFGEHKGKELCEVSPDYLRWLVSQEWVQPVTRDLLERYISTQPATAPAATPVAESLLDRMPPADLEAEKCLLGSLLIRPQLLPEIRKIIMPEDFHSDINRIIFQHMHGAFDVLLLRYRLRRAGKLEEVGDAYLADCVRFVPTAINAEEYAKIVLEKSQLRKLIRTATWLLQECYREERDASAIAAEAARLIT